MPMTMPVFPNGRGSPAIEPPAALMAATVAVMSFTLRITCAIGSFRSSESRCDDHDRLAFVGLCGVDRRTEVHEDLGPSGHVDPIDLLHAERGLVELRQRGGVFRADSHRVQRHLRVCGAREQQRRGY